MLIWIHTWINTYVHSWFWDFFYNRKNYYRPKTCLCTHVYYLRDFYILCIFIIIWRNPKVSVIHKEFSKSLCSHLSLFSLNNKETMAEKSVLNFLENKKKIWKRSLRRTTSSIDIFPLVKTFYTRLYTYLFFVLAHGKSAIDFPYYISQRNGALTK